MKALFWLILLSVSAQAATIIPATRRVTWQGNIGVTGGIPDSYGMTINAVLGLSTTRAQCQTALNSCPSNQVVVLTNGTFSSWGSGDLDWQGAGNGVVLRGMTNSDGTPSTYITSSACKIYMRSSGGFNETSLSTEVSLTADGNKGDTTISMGTVPAWAVADAYVGIDALDDTTLSFNPGQESGTSYRQVMGNGARGMAQLLHISSVTGTTITFDHPLAFSFLVANTAQIFQPGGSPTGYRKRCGIENIRLEHTGAGATDNHMMVMENCANCWVRNFQGSNVVGGIYIQGYYSYRCEVRHSRFDDAKSLGGGQGYGVGLYHVCTGWVVEDNIFRKLHVAMQNNYGSCYNVFGYNFETDGQSDSGQNPAFDCHGTTGYMTLYEGNWSMDKVLGDFTHGAGCYYTIFRNRVMGYNANQPTQNGNDQTAISIERYNRKYNVVGNLCGTNGWHTNVFCGINMGTDSSFYNITNCQDVSRSVYKFGFWADYGCDKSAGDSLATLDLILAQNYDTVTATNSGIVKGGFETSDLDNSYYLTAKPTWFGDRNWPPYTPATTTLAALSFTNIPAGWRFQFGGEVGSGGGGGGGGGQDSHPKLKRGGRSGIRR